MPSNAYEFSKNVPCYPIYAISEGDTFLMGTSTLVHYDGKIFFLNAGHTVSTAINDYNLKKLYVALPNQSKFSISLEASQTKYEDAIKTGGLDIAVTIVKNEQDISLLNSFKPIVLKDDDAIKDNGISVLLFVGYPVSKSTLSRNHAHIERVSVSVCEVQPEDFSGEVFEVEFEKVTLDATNHIVGHYAKDEIIIQKEEVQTQGRFYPKFIGLSGGAAFRSITNSSNSGFVGIGLLDLSRPRYLVALRSRAIMDYIDREF